LEYLVLFKDEKRNDDYLRLLRSWKNIEYKLVSEDKKSQYLKAADMLIDAEPEPEQKLQLLNEQLNIVRKNKFYEKEQIIYSKISSISNSFLRSINSRTKQLNSLFSAKKYDEAKTESRKILSWIRNYDDSNLDCFISALRVLLHIFASEKDYDRVIINFEDYKYLGYKDDNCVKIYEKAIKEKAKKQKDEIIQKISLNIQEAEHLLRSIIMDSLCNDENELIKLLSEKGKDEWFKQWKETKAKALNSDAMLIYYSDISHIRSLISWCKEKINSSKENNLRYKNKELIKNIVASLERYVNQERNETFHSRLQLYEKDRLDEFIVDTRRLLQLIEELKDNIAKSE